MAKSKVKVMSTWCPEFRPSRSEFSNFAHYIDTVVEPGASSVGLAKVIPPSNWYKSSIQIDTLTIPNPIRQHLTGKQGVFMLNLVEKKSMKGEEYEEWTQKFTLSDKPTSTTSIEEIERRFWRNLRSTMTAPLYGADAMVIPELNNSVFIEPFYIILFRALYLEKTRRVHGI